MPLYTTVRLEKEGKVLLIAPENTRGFSRVERDQGKIRALWQDGYDKGLARSGEIGLVKIVDAMRHRGGIRLWMVAGRLALEDYRTKQENIAAISAALSVKQPQAAQGVARMKAELEQVTFALNQARQALMAEKAKSLPQTEGNLCLFEDDLDAASLRALANAGMEVCGGICAVFTGTDKTGYRYVMGSKTVDLRAKAKEINQALGGKGGGQPTMIQGSVTADRAAILAYFQ